MTVRTLNLVLPEETVRTIEAKVASGRYPNAEAMIQNALEGLEGEEESFDDWIKREVIPEIEAMEADPSSGFTLEQVRAAIDEQEKGRFRKAG